MKTTPIVLLAVLALSSHSAFARLGETRQEIDKRYGPGKRCDYQRLEGAETVIYRFNNFDIEVVFHDDKSIWEIFHNSPKLNDIKLLLKANAGGQAT